MKTLILRCEASVEVGTGHVMRCIALAQEWKTRGHHALFAMSGKSIQLLKRPISEQMETVETTALAGSKADAIETSNLAKSRSACWVAVDGFMFGHHWHSALAQDLRVLRVGEDPPRFPLRADAVVSYAPNSAPADYPGISPGCAFLLGYRYVMLRQEFRVPPVKKLESPHILVTMGGSDPARFTDCCQAALLQPGTCGLPCEFLIGPANPCRDSLLAAIAPHAPRLSASPATRSIPEVFASAQWVITAGGTTIYELAFLGVPMLVVATAQNQIPIAEQFARLGAVRYLGWHKQLSVQRLASEITEFWRNSEYRNRLGKRAAQLVDGAGASRVVDHLLEELK